MRAFDLGTSKIPPQMCELVAGLVDTEFYFIKHGAVNLRIGGTLPSQNSNDFRAEWRISN